MQAKFSNTSKIVEDPGKKGSLPVRFSSGCLVFDSVVEESDRAQALPSVTELNSMVRDVFMKRTVGWPGSSGPRL